MSLSMVQLMLFDWQNEAASLEKTHQFNRWIVVGQLVSETSADSTAWDNPQQSGDENARWACDGETTYQNTGAKRRDRTGHRRNAQLPSRLVDNRIRIRVMGPKGLDEERTYDGGVCLSEMIR